MNAHELAPLNRRQTPARRRARAIKRDRRAANAHLRSFGVALPREVLDAATSDGYSPETFGREMADALKAAERRARLIKYAERAAAALLAIGLATAIWWLS